MIVEDPGNAQDPCLVEDPCLVGDPGQLPATPGAYALVMELNRPLAFRMHVLPAGLYVYAGSARGPGGIRARILRHLNREKRRHWHVDHLTAVASIVSIIAFPGADEHAVLGAALGLEGAETPVKGFGSTDCSSCPAHLVRLCGDAPLGEGALAVQSSSPPVMWRAAEGAPLPPATLFPT